MILGVYWYFGFPEGLYSFDYFKWLPGYGGHVNNPAALGCKVKAPDPDRLLQRLIMLVVEVEEGLITVYRSEDILKISIGSFQLWDYDFLLAEKVEEVLEEENVEMVVATPGRDGELIRVFNKNAKLPVYPRAAVFQLVFSERHASNAECAMLRMDCFLPAKGKAAFIAALDQVSAEENIEVLFYKECAYKGGFNLMVFFSNGRQGMNLQPLQRIAMNRLEKKVAAALHHHGGSVKHEGGWDFYPKGKDVVVRMVDEAFVLRA